MTSKTTRIQNRITELTTETRNAFRRQYPVAKWQVAALDAAGLSEYMPAGYGNADADAVCKDARIGKYENLPRECGQGDEVWRDCELAYLLDEADAPAPEPTTIEVYDGDEYIERVAVEYAQRRVDAGTHVLHTCEEGSGSTILLVRGCGCPNYRFGCKANLDLPAPESTPDHDEPAPTSADTELIVTVHREGLGRGEWCNVRFETEVALTPAVARRAARTMGWSPCTVWAPDMEYGYRVTVSGNTRKVYPSA